MGTRSRIGVMHGDVCKSVYCHWDGYLEYNGAILQEHYDSARANHLVALGDISSLRKNIVIPDGVEHTFEKPTDDITIFYGRDRGETGTEFKTDHNFADFLTRVENCGAEYYYIMRDGVWYVGSPYKGSKLVPLAEALNKDEPDSETQADLNETLGLDRNTSMEDLVAHIAELDGEAA
jgi:hypothetical protein